MINNEATQILPGNNGAENNSQSNTYAPVNNQPKQGGDGLARAAFAAGGFVAGVASTAAVNVMAAKFNHQKEEKLVADDPTPAPKQPEAPVAPEPKQPEVPTPEPEAPTPAPEPAKPAEPQRPETTDVKVEKVDPKDIPSEQESIIVTDEGIRVAQVDDEMTFSEAFAEARQQVGPGGVFEWHGKVYGTYYKTEWEQMSGNERAEWQARVDYNDVRDTEEPVPVRHITDNPEIKVAAVGEFEMENGETYDAAVLEDNTGDQLLLLDVDGDGTYDLGLHDDNQNGQIEEDEFYDVSDLNATVQEMQLAYLEQNVIVCASNNDMPDYANNADTSSFV